MTTRTLKIPAVLFRTGTSTTKDNGEMELSISSDTPYLRYDWYSDEDYFEVLDHSADGMDSSRLRAGAALLFNHNRDIQLGTLNAPEMRDGKCFVKAKVSAAPDIASYKVRMDEGILKDSSVGYTITDDGICIGAKDGIPVYKFKWSPHEASMVTIPADISVGLGKDHNPRWNSQPGKEPELKEITVKFEKEFDNLAKKSQKKSTQKIMAEITEPVIPPVKQPEINIVEEGKKAVTEFQARCKKIREYAEVLKNPKWRETAVTIATKHLEGEANVSNFMDECRAAFDGLIETSQISPEIGLDNKDLRRYSICELILQAGSKKGISGLYKEASDAVAKLTRKDPDGVWIPDDVTGRSLQQIHGLGRNQMKNQASRIQQAAEHFARALTATNFTSGGALVGTDLLAGSLIELLLNKIQFLNGFTHLGGLVGNIAIPKVTGPVANSFWLPEGGTVTSNDMSFGQLGLTPHRLAATMAYDKQLVAQASLSVEALVRDYIARIMAVEKNRAMINGSGAAGQPFGLLNIAGVQSVTTTAGTGLTWAQVVNFKTVLGTANADMLGELSWLTTPAAEGNLASLPKIGTTFPVFMLDDNGKVRGYELNTTNNVPGNLLIFGVGSEFIVADWAGIDIVVNPYSLDTSGQIRVTVQQWTDNGARHEVAFAVGTSAAA